MMMRMHLRVSSPLFSSVFHPSSTLVSSVFFSDGELDEEALKAIAEGLAELDFLKNI